MIIMTMLLPTINSELKSLTYAELPGRTSLYCLF